MAIYHLTVKHGSRANGQSAVAKVEYIARLGKYADRDDLLRVGSGHLPSWASSALMFWYGADTYSRANARLFTEIEAALPNELSPDQMTELVQRFVERISSFGVGHVPYTWGIHRKDRNPHVHIVLAARVEDGVARDGGKAWFRRANKAVPEKGGAASWSEQTDKDWLEEMRDLFAHLTNEALAKVSSAVRVDHRSHARRGMVAVPTQHAGWAPRRRREVLEYNARALAANEEAVAAASQVVALRRQCRDELEAEQVAWEAVRANRRLAHRHLRLEQECLALLQVRNAAAIRAEPSTQRLYAPAPRLRPQFIAKRGRYGTLYIRMPADTLALVDRGFQLTMKEDEPVSIRAALMLAASRWQKFEATCPPEQHAAWVNEATALGLGGRLRLTSLPPGKHKESGGGKPRHPHSIQR